MNDRTSRFCELLSEMTKRELREQLQVHEHFYHFTPRDNLPSIQKYGLDPSFESNDSSYAGRRYEPAKAMRYCTKTQTGLNAGLQTAIVRSFPSDILDPSVLNKKIALLRTNSTSLLRREFGLDHSHSDVLAAVQEINSHSTQMTAEEFMNIISEYGVLSSYEPIPAAELELCTSDIELFRRDLVGEFVPLPRENRQLVIGW